MSRPFEDDDRPLSAERVELVAIDLDGTLLRSDGSICAPSAEAIMEAAELGVKVVLTSGRAPRSMRPIHGALGLNTVLIAHNGAMVYDPIADQMVAHETMPGPLARRVVELARQVDPTVAAGVEVDGKTYTDTLQRRQQAMAAAKATSGKAAGAGAAVLQATPAVQVPASGFDSAAGLLVDVLDRPVTKVMLVGPPDVLGGILMSLQSRMSGQVDFAFSDLKLLQVVRAGVDKATALEKVANLYGISRQSVMAIGDAPNDVGMLRWAGLGVAMGNAWDEVRQAAHFACPSNDDGGVAEAIRKYVLCR
jgi:Cof subfamily protein (haloacid dehalogenase superfamily)